MKNSLKSVLFLIITSAHLLICSSVLAQQIKAPAKKEEPKKKTSVTPTKETSANKLTLKVSPNLRCSLKIDGETKGIIEADNIFKVYLNKGTFQVEAISTENNQIKFNEVYTVDEVNIEKLYKIDLIKIRDAKNINNPKNTNNTTKTNNTTSNTKDNKNYKTVIIGTQTWMAENVNYAASSGSWCYDNKSSNCDLFGRLYNWETAKNICSSGWHLPSDDEWKKLTDFIGANSGTKLKAISYWNSSGNNSDDFSFSALPGGSRGSGDFYTGASSRTCWWSATESDTADAWTRELINNYSGITRKHNSKSMGFSVRCVKD